MVVLKLYPTKTNIICCGMFVMSLKYLILVMHLKCSFVIRVKSIICEKKYKNKNKNEQTT